MSHGPSSLTYSQMLNWQFGKSPAVTPAGIVYIGLHVGSPGHDGQSGTEATGSGYARVLTAATDWAAAVTASGVVTLSNATEIVFAAASGDWSSGGEHTHWTMWNHLTNNAASNFLYSGQITVGSPAVASPLIVLNTHQPRWAVGKLLTRGSQAADI